MNDDEVLEALQVIKKYCGEQAQDSCKGCRLYNEAGKGCTLSIDSPFEWRINVNKEYKFIL